MSGIQFICFTYYIIDVLLRDLDVYVALRKNISLRLEDDYVKEIGLRNDNTILYHCFKLYTKSFELKLLLLNSTK